MNHTSLKLELCIQLQTTELEHQKKIPMTIQVLDKNSTRRPTFFLLGSNPYLKQIRYTLN